VRRSKEDKGFAFITPLKREGIVVDTKKDQIFPVEIRTDSEVSRKS